MPAIVNIAAYKFVSLDRLPERQRAVQERAAAEAVLEQLRAHPSGKEAAMIGEVVERKGVRLTGLYGVKRTLDLPHAEPLPRIC